MKSQVYVPMSNYFHTVRVFSVVVFSMRTGRVLIGEWANDKGVKMYYEK